MKRWASVALFVVAVVATACQPAPPPRGWVPPVIQSFSVSTESVSPGETFTLSITATDDHAVRVLYVQFRHPSGEYYELIQCRLGDEPGTVHSFPGNQPVVSVDIDCVMPYAPNGLWEVETFAFDSESSGNALRAPLTVVGGADDTTPPVIESVRVAPEPLYTNSAFDLIIRVSDNAPLNPAARAPQAWYAPSGHECFTGTAEQLTPTLQEWTVPCRATGGKAGPNEAVFAVWDAAGNRVGQRYAFEVLARP